MLQPVDIDRVGRIVRDIVLQGGFSCEVVAVHDDPRSWRVTVRDEGQRLVTFAVPKGTPVQVREAIVNALDSAE